MPLERPELFPNADILSNGGVRINPGFSIGGVSKTQKLGLMRMPLLFIAAVEGAIILTLV